MPSVRTVFIRFDVVIDELFGIKLDFRRRNFYPLLDDERTKNQAAAEQQAETERDAQPERYGRNLG